MRVRNNTLLMVSMMLTTVSMIVVSVAAFHQSIPNHLNDLRTVRAQYGSTLNQAQAGEMLNKLTWQLRGEGFGLLRKDGGNNCPQPTTGVRVSCDWVVHSPTGLGCDVLGSGPDPDAPGPSNPTWCSGEPYDTSRFVPPVNPGSPGPVQPPTPVDDSTAKRLVSLEAKIAALESRVTQLQAQLDSAPTPAPVTITEDRVRQLVAADTVNLFVTGRSGQSFGHSHPVNLQVSRR